MRATGFALIAIIALQPDRVPVPVAIANDGYPLPSATLTVWHYDLLPREVDLTCWAF